MAIAFFSLNVFGHVIETLINLITIACAIDIPNSPVALCSVKQLPIEKF